MFGLFKKKTTEVPVNARSYMDEVREITEPSFQIAPFKMKRNEQYIGSSNAVLYIYKNNGRFGVVGASTGVKVAGVRFRIGGGQVATSKSWQAEQSGELHFTTDRVIFNGSNKNYSVQWSKVIAFSITSDGTEISFDRESGPDWLFKLAKPMSIEQMATVIMVEENKI